MKYGLGGLFLAGGLALSISTAKADPLTLTSPQIQDNGTLAVKNACNDKQRSPNCVGENVSPPLAWSGVPEGTKSFALLLFDPEGRAPAGVSHMVVYGIPADVKGFAEGERASRPTNSSAGRVRWRNRFISAQAPRRIPTGIITPGRWSPPTSTRKRCSPA